MISDLRDYPGDATLNSDICIIGGGPAGITLAQSLSKSGRSVILCEGGGDSYSQESQDQYSGKVIGDPYYDIRASRLRFLGGSSNHWSGLCRPLDPIDFERKPNFLKAYWPIEKKDLDDFTMQACEILEISPPKPSSSFEDSDALDEIYFSFSRPPIRFKNKYKTALANSKKIQVLLNANFFGLDAIDGRVTRAIFKSSPDRTHRINARLFVFAMGGIENSRMLLWCKANSKSGGLGDRRIPIGCYWMEHPHHTLGEMLLTSKGLRLGETRYVSLKPIHQRELGVLNCALRLQVMGETSTRRLIKDLLCIAPSAGSRAALLFGKGLDCGVTIRAAWEQEPLKTNRVQLSSSDRDVFGIPLTELYWKKSVNDFRTVYENVLRLNDFLMQSNSGRLRLNHWVYGKGNPPPPENDSKGGHHHMGGTRMAENPVDGVVDRNCRVFGTSNLFVAGSSVFPTGGHANPTFTIIQLSLRLADYLKSF